MLELYKNIQQRRLELGMTQKELAIKAGYGDRSSICKIEKGLVDIPQTKISAFAKALETTESDLLGWMEPEISSAELLADIAGNKRMLEYIAKIKDLSDEKKEEVFSFIDFITRKK